MEYCQFIIDFHMEPGEDGDPIFCDKPAPIKYDGAWFCAEHYDLLMTSPKGGGGGGSGGGYVYRQGMDKNTAFAFFYGRGLAAVRMP